MTTATADVVEDLMLLARRLRHASIRLLAPLGLTPAQERTLRLLSRYGAEGIRIGELANRLGVVPRTATGLVDGLEQAGLAERTPDPDSRRSVLVRLTEAGRRLQDDMAAARLQAGEELLGPLDEADRERLAVLLSRIAGPVAQRRHRH